VIPSVSLGEKLVTLVDRLKTEGFQGQTIRDHTISRAFDLAIELQVVETEKVLNCFIRARRDAFSLRPKHLIWLTVVNRKQNFLSHFLGFFPKYEFKA
jgi:hypothetical protein